MAKPILSQAHFHNEDAAFAYVEERIWPNGPTCPHCGNADAAKIGSLKARTKPTAKSPEGLPRHGLRKCYVCRKEFTVRKGTIFEETHLPLHLWLQAIHLLSSGKKGVSTRHIQRLLQCSMKTAWFLTHRIREIMGISPDGNSPLGGEGKHVEADETYFGRRHGVPKAKGGGSHKMAILSLIERGGEARSFYIERTTSKNIAPIIAKHIDPKSVLNTDEADHYIRLGRQFAGHGSVSHARGEYVKGSASTNTAEGFFSVFKRGMIGVYQHCDERHLHRYLKEFDFRYSNREKLGIDDATRASLAVKGAKGKRLTYRTVGGA